MRFQGEAGAAEYSIQFFDKKGAGIGGASFLALDLDEAKHEALALALDFPAAVLMRIQRKGTLEILWLELSEKPPSKSTN